MFILYIILYSILLQNIFNKFISTYKCSDAVGEGTLLAARLEKRAQIARQRQLVREQCLPAVAPALTTRAIWGEEMHLYIRFTYTII